MAQPHLALVGPTAVGKSALALALARRAGDVEIVAVDSMQVYRGMDIGTSTPTAAERAEVPHHLLDLADPGEEFSVSAFQRAAKEALTGIEARGRRALLVAGTGLYLRAILDDLELPGRWPEVRCALEAEVDTAVLHARLRQLDAPAAERMEPSNRRRVVRALEVCLGSGRPFSSFGPGLDAYPPGAIGQIGLHLTLPELDRRIEDRFRAMLDAGLLDEVRTLAARPRGLSRTASQALGYRELLAHLQGSCTLAQAVEEAIRRTRRYARRQLRWYRRDSRIAWAAASAGGEGGGAGADLLGDWASCS